MCNDTTTINSNKILVVVLTVSSHPLFSPLFAPGRDKQTVLGFCCLRVLIIIIIIGNTNTNTNTNTKNADNTINTNNTINSINTSNPAALAGCQLYCRRCV